MEALFSYLLEIISNSYNLFTESQVLSLMRSCVCTGEGTPSKSSSIGREEIPSSSLTLAPIQLTEKRLEAGSGCWLQSSPSVSGPPKTRGSCWSLPELQAMLKIAPMAAPACSVENEFKEVGGLQSPVGTECSLGALWVVGQLPSQQETSGQAAALGDTSAAGEEQFLCAIENRYWEEKNR